MADKILIVIAHRLATICDAEQILVLEYGKIGHAGISPPAPAYHDGAVWFAYAMAQRAAVTPDDESPNG